MLTTLTFHCLRSPFIQPRFNRILHSAIFLRHQVYGPSLIIPHLSIKLVGLIRAVSVKNELSFGHNLLFLRILYNSPTIKGT